MKYLTDDNLPLINCSHLMSRMLPLRKWDSSGGRRPADGIESRFVITEIKWTRSFSFFVRGSLSGAIFEQQNGIRSLSSYVRDCCVGFLPGHKNGGYEVATSIGGTGSLIFEGRFLTGETSYVRC
jgi:hypothetical protein